MPDTTSTSPKDLIASNARVLFEAHGFAGTSVRTIAGAAGVDPSLVIRHFGSKESLFIKVIGLDGYVAPPVEGPLESLGERLVTSVLAPEHAEFRARLAAMVRASDREAIREGLRLTVRRIFIDELVAVLPGDDREARAHLISAQLGGIIQASAVIDGELRELISLERIIALYGGAIQAIVDA